ncbi:hypothetical protein JHK85_009760 [Glycine max]|nr:hypothetical protein JHK85_009760 [Glycine max]KAG5065772.1 hypothetical protein JHK86_009503 [Glycine max]
MPRTCLESSNLMKFSEIYRSRHTSSLPRISLLKFTKPTEPKVDPPPETLRGSVLHAFFSIQPIVREKPSALVSTSCKIRIASIWRENCFYMPNGV